MNVKVWVRLCRGACQIHSFSEKVLHKIVQRWFAYQMNMCEIFYGSIVLGATNYVVLSPCEEIFNVITCKPECCETHVCPTICYLWLSKQVPGYGDQALKQGMLYHSMKLNRIKYM